ncbi:hypothetical protein D3C73_1558090 [compost metagenome]
MHLLARVQVTDKLSLVYWRYARSEAQLHEEHQDHRDSHDNAHARVKLKILLYLLKEQEY